MDKQMYIEKMIKIYLKLCHSKGWYKIPASTKKEHKNYKYFEKIYNMYNRVPNFDIYTFIEANLEDTKNNPRYPSQLATKVAFKRYRDYSLKLNAKNNNKTQAKDILIESFNNSVDTIKNRFDKYDPYNLFEPDIPSALSVGLFLLIKGGISKYYCVMCRPFWEKIKILDKDFLQFFDLFELKSIRDYILSFSKPTINKLKKIMEDKYWI